MIIATGSASKVIDVLPSATRNMQATVANELGSKLERRKTYVTSTSSVVLAALQRSMRLQPTHVSPSFVNLWVDFAPGSALHQKKLGFRHRAFWGYDDLRSR